MVRPPGLEIVRDDGDGLMFGETMEVEGVGIALEFLAFLDGFLGQLELPVLDLLDELARVLGIQGRDRVLDGLFVLAAAVGNQLARRTGSLL